MLFRAVIKSTLILVLSVFGVMFLSNNTEAYNVKDFERKIKLKILPEYCAYMQQGPRTHKPERGRYLEFLGKGWHHTHHYCWALDQMLLASLSILDENQFKHYLFGAISDLNYVLKNTSGYYFILKPEVLSKKGKALALLGRDVEAIQAFLSAIHLKPNFVLPYIQLSMLYVEKGEIEEAQNILDRGLEHSPNSSLLKEALAELHLETK